MKTWYASKTLWVNLLALIALLLQQRYGYIFDGEAQAALLGFINLALRTVTNQRLEWQLPKSGPPLPGMMFLAVLLLLSGCAYNSITVTAAGNVTVNGSVDKPVSVDTARGLGQGATLSAVPGL